MFTGIVEELGTIRKIENRKNLLRITVSAKKIIRGCLLGESMSINGVCLTIVSVKNSLVSFDVMKETIQSTTLRNLKPKDPVNLERALSAQSRFGGHFVTGHVDGIGRITGKIRLPNYVELTIGARREIMRYVAVKGSICINGVSLTVGKLAKNHFTVYLIPFTLKYTTLGQAQIGREVNIETDILAKYILSSSKSKAKPRKAI